MSFTFNAVSQSVNQKDKPQITTRILFVFDASQSMYGRWQSDMKINIAQKLLSELLDSLHNVTDLQLALRVYGHQFDYKDFQHCEDTKLEVPFDWQNTMKIKQKLNTIVPKGTTPIARSLEESANDFPPCDNCRNIIILITDGLEECSGDPCAVSLALQKKGIVLKPFIIGIGKNFAEAFDCVGTYFDASDETTFRKALNVVISQALNSTTAQVNLLDIEGNPTETNVNMTFYDNFSGHIKYNFIHTFNSKGIPDTLVIDPLTNYNIVVSTIPPVKIDSVKITAGKHNIIGIDAPQGFLKLKTSAGGNISKNFQCIIREKDKQETMHVQNFSETVKYITGLYDLEILCLPRLIVEDVEIKQSHTTDVIIPQPGIAFINMLTSGYGSLYLEEDNQLKWVYNLTSTTSSESIVLQPGNYRVVFRSKMANRSFYTTEKSFEINPGLTTSIKLF